MDTGISTYEKTARRQYERGTAAHNTVVLGDKNSSEVWGGFRVGRRARVTLLKDSPNEVEAWHDGFGSLGRHLRKFTIDKVVLGRGFCLNSRESRKLDPSGSGCGGSYLVH